MTGITEAELARLEALEKAATPGPWKSDAHYAESGIAIARFTYRLLGDTFAYSHDRSPWNGWG